MPTLTSKCRNLTLWALLGALLLSAGCLPCQYTPHCRHRVHPIVPYDAPKELDKVTLPYIIEPPDILLLDVLRAIPQPPYRIEPLDILLVQATQVLPDQDINGLATVEPNGMVNLGLEYGSVRVGGMTLDDARVAIEKHLKQRGFTQPKVVVILQQSAGVQQIRGEHLVRPDGTVGLGQYGGVYVAGMTLDQAKVAIETYLARHLVDPKIALDVFAYNSKAYYIIFDGGGYGQQIFRLPATGNETILDALSHVSGLPAVSSTKKIWIARPMGSDNCEEQVLPVDWCAITKCAGSATNYQIMPGDRVYVKADGMIAFDNLVAKLTSPFERMFGFTLLGYETIRTTQIKNQNSGVGGGGF